MCWDLFLDLYSTVLLLIYVDVNGSTCHFIIADKTVYNRQLTEEKPLQVQASLYSIISIEYPAYQASWLLTYLNKQGPQNKDINHGRA